MTKEEFEIQEADIEIPQTTIKVAHLDVTVNTYPRNYAEEIYGTVKYAGEIDGDELHGEMGLPKKHRIRIEHPEGGVEVLEEVLFTEVNQDKKELMFHARSRRYF